MANGTEITNGNHGLPAGATTPLPRWISSLVAAVGEVEGRPSLPATMMPNATQRASIESRIDEIEAALAPASLRDLTLAVGEMFTVYPSNLSVEANKLKIAGFAQDLAGLPLWAVRQAASKWRRGEANGDVRFAPSVGEWRRLAEAQTLDHRMQITKLRRLLSAEPISRERPSKEARERVAANIGDILAKLSEGGRA